MRGTHESIRPAANLPLLERGREDSESGSAVVEFAASAILLFTLVFGTLECSRAVYIYHFVANAAQEAGHYAMVRGATWGTSCASVTAANCIASSDNVSFFVQGLASAGVNEANLTTNTSWPGYDVTGAPCMASSSVPSNAAGCLVVVKLTYAFSFVSPLLPQKTLALTSTSKVTIVE